MDFATIPIDLLTPGPYIEFDNSRAFQGLPGQRHKVLAIGQRLAAGTVAAGVPIRILSKDQARQSFGVSSMLAAMCEVFKRNSPSVELWAVALDDDGAGAQAQGTITITGPATAAGTLFLRVADTAVPVAVAKDDTAATIATAVVAAITADVTLPLTATSLAGVVTVVYKHKGEVGNCIDVRANYNQGEALPAGVGVAIVCPTGGAVNPDIATALAAVGAEQYLTIITPYNDADNLTTLETELDARWEGTQSNDGHAYTYVGGTHADGSTLGISRNNPHLDIIPIQKSPTPGYLVAAAAAAQDAGESSPNRPRQTLPLIGVSPPSVADRYTADERAQHLKDGVASWYVDSGGVCRIERLFTTYKKNALNIDDFSYREVEILRTLSYLRFDTRFIISNTFPRHLLTDDDAKIDPDSFIAQPKAVREILIGRASAWERAGLIRDLAQFKAELIVELDPDVPGRVNALIPPTLVGGFRIFAGKIQYRL